MSEDKLDKAFATVEPSRRAFLKKLVISSGFAIPIVASYSVTDLANAAGVGSPMTTTMTVSSLPASTIFPTTTGFLTSTTFFPTTTGFFPTTTFAFPTTP